VLSFVCVKAGKGAANKHAQTNAVILRQDPFMMLADLREKCDAAGTGKVPAALKCSVV